MTQPEMSQSPLGVRVTRVFFPYPEYTIEDYDEMRVLIGDAMMYGYAAVKLSSSDRITVATIGADE